MDHYPTETIEDIKSDTDCDVPSILVTTKNDFGTYVKSYNDWDDTCKSLAWLSDLDMQSVEDQTKCTFLLDGSMYIIEIIS